MYNSIEVQIQVSTTVSLKSSALSLISGNFCVSHLYSDGTPIISGIRNLQAEIDKQHFERANCYQHSTVAFSGAEIDSNNRDVFRVIYYKI